MTRQRGSSIPHNMRRRPRHTLFFVGKSTASHLTTPNTFTRVHRHLTETPPLDELFLDRLHRPPSVRRTTATPQFVGRERVTAKMDMIGTTTEPEFEELPIAVQRKVCRPVFLYFETAVV